MLLTSSDAQVGPIEAQSLAGAHVQLSLDSVLGDPVAWGKLVMITLAEQA